MELFSDNNTNFAGKYELIMANSGKKEKEGALAAFFKDGRTRLFLGLAIIFFASLMVVAFVSYFFTWKYDQSFEWSKLFSLATDREVQNWGGKVGARLAEQFMNKGFGIPAFFIPFFLYIIGFRFFRIRLMHIWKAFFFASVSMLLFSASLGFLFGEAGGYMGSGMGGAHGFYIAEWITSLLGTIGAGGFLALLLFFYLFVTFKSFAKWSSNRMGGLRNQLQYAITDYRKREAIKKPLADKAKGPAVITVDTPSPAEAGNEVNPYQLTVEPDGDSAPEEEEASVASDETVVPRPEEVELTVTQKRESEKPADHIASRVEAYGEYDPTLDLSHYKLPSIDLLEEHHSGAQEVSNEELLNNKKKIIETLANYKIQIEKIKATIGPTVTLYEIVPAPGVRISRIKNLEDDIALSLSALGIRIIAPMPGKGTIGIEVPNQYPEIVSMRSIIASKRFQESTGDLTVALGKTISNETFVFDLTKMPHLLVAGATGQGKSVGLNAIITSILYKKHPAQVKFVLVDPKKVELTLYSKIERHFLAMLPDGDEAIITDTQRVINTLNSLCIEMDTRYDLLRMAEVRNIKEYNARFVSRRLLPTEGHRYLPYIVVIVDEFADLIMTAGREIEMPISRLAQLARAVGIHLVIATQRPSVNIITGTIKANFPARIAFRVTSKIDSRTILDMGGADQLVGRGDLLLSTGQEMIRLQCAFIDIPELERITDFIGSQQGYASALQLPEYYGEESAADNKEVDLSKRDELFSDAARLLVMHQQGSTSLIQRKFSIGYARAGRIMDQLEAANIVGPFEGSKARQVLFVDQASLEQYLRDHF